MSEPSETKSPSKSPNKTSPAEEKSPSKSPNKTPPAEEKSPNKTSPAEEKSPSKSPSKSPVKTSPAEEKSPVEVTSPNKSKETDKPPVASRSTIKRLSDAASASKNALGSLSKSLSSGTKHLASGISKASDSIATSQNFMKLPMTVPLAILLYSLLQTNQPKESGLIYLAFLTFFVVVRTIITSAAFSIDDLELPTNCYFEFIKKRPEASVFVSVFSLFYILFPMIFQSSYKATPLVILGIYVLTTIAMNRNCYSETAMKKILLFDIVFGSALALASIGILIGFSLLAKVEPSYLFISKSDSATCPLPSKQKMTCSVYKNGELVTKIKP